MLRQLALAVAIAWPALAEAAVIECNRELPVTKDGVFGWQVDFKVGDQHLRGDLDTGSAYLLLNPDIYKPESTSRNLHKNATIRQDLHADVYTDSIQLGPLSGVNLPLGVLAKGETTTGNAGLVGLGFEGGNPVLNGWLGPLNAQQDQPLTVFNLDLYEDGGTLTIDPPRSRQYEGELVHFPLVLPEGVHGQPWFIESHLNGQKFTAWIDSGTGRIIMPEGPFRRLAARLNLTIQEETEAGILYMWGDGRTLPSVIFDFHNEATGKKMQVSLDHEAFWIGGTIQKGKEKDYPPHTLFASIQGVIGQAEDAVWFLGDPFFMSSFVSFDLAGKRIGIAQKKEKHE